MSTPKRTRRASKIRPVAIRDMKVPPAGITQRRYNKAQAEDYAQNLDFDKLGIPIVNQRDGTYWILDGQHRIAALKMFFAPNDPGQIDCEVYEQLSDAEMAEIFLGRDNRRAISIFEKFQVACTAERSRECDVRRTVETQGLRISRQKEDGCIGAVSALMKVYDRSDGALLGRVLRVLRDAFDSSADAFDGALIDATGMVFHRYNGKVDERQLIEQLSSTRVATLFQRAEDKRSRTGNLKVPCMAAVLVDLYNKSKTHKSRLADWWKDSK